MRIESEEAASTTTFGGTTYYFCSLSCYDAFMADPGTYVGSTPQQNG
jgi:YHS domain-containing protein